MSASVPIAMTFGMIISLFFVVPMIDSRGRKFVAVYMRFFLGSATSTFLVLSAFLNSAELFFLSQILVGVNFFIQSFVTTMFIGECAADKNRGFATTFHSIMDVVVSLIVYYVSSPKVLGNEKWFIYPIVSFILCLAFVVAASILPESPKYLVKKNEYLAAKRSIKFYQDKDADLEEVFNSLLRENNLVAKEKLSFRQVYKDKTLREALKILFALELYEIFTPSAVERIYRITLHNSLGFSAEQSLNLNFILTLVFSPTRFVGSFLIDILGRRFIFFFSAALMFLKTVLMAVAQFFAFFDGPSTLTRVFLVISEASSDLILATGVSVLTSLFTLELFPAPARVAVTQVNIFIYMLSSTPMMVLYPILNTTFPSAFYIPLIFMQLPIVIYLYRNMPETKARAVCDIVEDMEHVVRSRNTTINEHAPLIGKT
ncbi:unnamed protein product [Caenorhabditis auriculariae]|uniref:Major facilitator superfamily (MFS) profile domain-containing protein n=1 Tax=Caenorhabditis auriculariae TaxID=2777116 RepID=A0A8S1GPI2_9PELO|nr:unnamed protein product [Caenorhabditis auriculariae]